MIVVNGESAIVNEGVFFEPGFITVICIVAPACRQRQVAHLYALFNNELNAAVNDTCLQAGNEAD